MTTTPHDPHSPALEMLDIDKRFGGVHALDRASLAAYDGEILGLCGENGAGKSTILKILSGVYPAGSYGGEVKVRGQVLRLRNTSDARRAGIAMVHQELMLVPELSVAENLLLGREPGRFGLIDTPALEAAARKMLEKYGFAGEIDPTATTGSLGIGVQQLVEIVRTLSHDGKILILDEPTAALTAREADRLMAWLRDLRAAGTTCIYVSHRMDEVFALCDRVTVLRNGRTAGTKIMAETTPREVVALMVGRTIDDKPIRSDKPNENARVALEIVDLHVGLPGTSRSSPWPKPEERLAVSNVSLRVREGEIVALAGAMGSGRTAILSTLFGGALGPIAGEIRVSGERVVIDSPRQAFALGLAFLPEDRKSRGLVLDMSVAENLSLPWLGSSDIMGPDAKLGLVDENAATLMSAKRIDELHIRGSSEAIVGTLSGGNQQKVVLGKWLARPPKVLLLDEPTRGVDIGAREEIYSILNDLASRGMAILMASSDLGEVRRLAHRILVLRHGRIVGELDPRTATEEAIVELSTGAATINTSTSHDVPGQTQPPPVNLS
jgi:D-xylose transport system ATP-binding protein